MSSDEATRGLIDLPRCRAASGIVPLTLRCQLLPAVVPILPARREPVSASAVRSSMPCFRLRCAGYDATAMCAADAILSPATRLESVVNQLGPVLDSRPGTASSRHCLGRQEKPGLLNDCLQSGVGRARDPARACRHWGFKSLRATHSSRSVSACDPGGGQGIDQRAAQGGCPALPVAISCKAGQRCLRITSTSKSWVEVDAWWQSAMSTATKTLTKLPASGA